MGEVPVEPFAASYERWSFAYGPLARRLSLGAIPRARRYHHRFLRPGDRVLAAGVGEGEEVPGALASGATVRGYELSPTLLGRARHLAPAADLRQGDVFSDTGRDYDAVTAHFFLNLYATDAMRRALAELAARLRPGGLLFVADFASGGHPGARVLRATCYLPIALAGRWLGLSRLHPRHDYGSYFEEAGLTVVARDAFPVGPFPALYETWVGARL